MHASVRGLVAITLVVGGCVGAPKAQQQQAASAPDDPARLLALLASTATPEESRLAADRKLAAMSAVEGRLAVLEQLVYQPGQSERMRIHAIDELAAADPARCARVLTMQLPRMEEWPVLAHACKVATKLDDPRLLGPLVRSLSRPSTTRQLAERPESAAIESLSGKKIADALADTLATARDIDTRLAAVIALPLVTSADEARRRVQAATPRTTSDAFLADIKWSGETFGHLPMNRNEYDWLAALRRDERAASHVVAMHKAFSSSGDYAFAPRFAGILSLAHTARAADLRLSDAAALLRDVDARLTELPHAAREPSYPGAPDDVRESLSANRAKLTRGDLLTIRVLLDALARPEFRREVLRLGLDDMSDTTTEHGGLLAPADPARPESLALELFAPYVARNDQAYMASDKLLAATTRGVAQFHFHFQQVHNAAHAGPGAGDLSYARTNLVNCVVFTSTGKNRFNADYYTPSGAVVDLGVYSGE